MRRGRNSLLGCVAIMAGVIIILSLVLPSAFWWFILAALLICFGFWYIRCCCAETAENQGMGNMTEEQKSMRIFVFKLPRLLASILAKLRKTE